MNRDIQVSISGFAMGFLSWFIGAFTASRSQELINEGINEGFLKAFLALLHFPMLAGALIGSIGAVLYFTGDRDD